MFPKTLFFICKKGKKSKCFISLFSTFQNQKKKKNVISAIYSKQSDRSEKGNKREKTQFSSVLRENHISDPKRKFGYKNQTFSLKNCDA